MNTQPIDSFLDIGNDSRGGETEGADSIDEEIEKDISEYQKQNQTKRMYVQANDSDADPAFSSRLKRHAQK